MKEIVLHQEKFDLPIVLGLGFFDCVHAGHRKLIERIKANASSLNAKTAIVTFSNNPYKIFNPDSKLIYTYKERKTLFKEAGIEFCVPFKFDKYFKSTPYEEFLETLFSNLNIKGIVCGYDYTFGKGGNGTTEVLTKYCVEKNISIEVIDPVIIENERVSSTIIKQNLQNGNIEKANKLLQKPFFMTGTVVNGRGVGKGYGMPTANLHFSKDKILIKHGVYSTRTYLDGKWRKSVTSIGTKPTFSEPSVTVETMIENWREDLYEKELKIEFYSYLRPIKKFDSPNELAEQIKIDLAK